MKEAIILMGIPACGKSTLAIELEGKGYIRINRDTIRKENPEYSEDEVRKHKNNMIVAADAMGHNVVIDDTNLNPKTLNSTRTFCESLGYDVIVIDVFEALIYKIQEERLKCLLYEDEDRADPIDALKECIERNDKRTEKVPVSVLYDMYLQSGRDFRCKKVVFVDLDGTLYNMQHRLKYLQDDRRQWDKFECDEEIEKDEVYPAVRDCINALRVAGYTIILLSGRKNTVCGQTVKNLYRDNVDYDALLMRQAWDNRPDNQVKKQFLDLVRQRHEIAFVFDDRKQVIDMWESEGIYVFNCNKRESNDF